MSCIYVTVIVWYYSWVVGLVARLVSQFVPTSPPTAHPEMRTPCLQIWTSLVTELQGPDSPISELFRGLEHR